MSKISTIYDTILATIPTITGFSDKFQIPNPIDLPDNDYNILRNGWGFFAGPVTFSTFQQTCGSWNETREIPITITREVRYLAHNATPFITASKALLEDAYELKKRFLNDDQLTIDLSVQRIDLINDTGILYLQFDKQKIAFITVLFTVQVEEKYQ